MAEKNMTPGPGHVPVMIDEVLVALAPREGGQYVDGTFGAGGYARAILESAQCTVLGIDRDPRAVSLGAALAEEFPGRLVMAEGRYSQMVELVAGEGMDGVDGVVLDLGVSSMQLDEAERGFSFMRDGPLDMRMDQGRDVDTPSVEDVVNSVPERELARIIYVLGEERASRRIAKVIVEARKLERITRTLQLAGLVEQALGARGRKQKTHPATRTFQALRIYVNRELEELAHGLSAAERILKPGGQLAVVSFHSLEDRIVKAFLAARSGRRARPSRHMPDVGDVGPAPSFVIASGGARKPSDYEIDTNPRSRSARLRCGGRTEAPPHEVDLTALHVPGFQ
jgi:16S rRNA (cytosine1402-N4)-methyltransferase